MTETTRLTIVFLMAQVFPFLNEWIVSSSLLCFPSHHSEASAEGGYWHAFRAPDTITAHSVKAD